MQFDRFYWRHARYGVFMAIACACFTSPALSQTVTVASGASFVLGAGTLTTGCGDVNVAGQFQVGSGTVTGTNNVSISGGTLDGGSGLVSLSGNWSNAGTFVPGSGTVRVVDGCGATESQIIGDNTFAAFSANSGTGKQLTIASSSTQTFNNALSLTGASGNRLLVRSSTPGSSAAFVLKPGASQTIQSVDVSDNDASGGETIAPDVPSAFDSVRGKNILNWFMEIAPPIPVDTLPLPALLALIALVGLALRRKLPSTRAAHHA